MKSTTPCNIHTTRMLIYLNTHVFINNGYQLLFDKLHAAVLKRGELNYRVELRRIYTTFVLGTALQNSGTRANRFGHGPLDLHDKMCSSFFNVDFSNGTPKTRTALLNLWAPALMWQRLTYWFQAHFRHAFAGCSKISWQILQCKKHLWLVALKCRNVIRDKVVSYNTLGQIYQNSLRSHLTLVDGKKMAKFKVQEYLFGK